MMEVQKVTFRYPEREVLRGISFKVEPGTVNFLLGANGAGKTTLFRCMLGLLSGYGGRIELKGNEIRTMSDRQRAACMAYIPQAHAAVFAYTVLDVVLMGLSRRLSMFAAPGRRERESAMHALRQMEIDHLAERSYQQLSGGEQQLVLIARALAQQASILMMDEPTSSLDFGNQIRVQEQVCKLTKRGYTVILSSHQPQHALSFADRVLALGQGRIIADGAPGEVISESLIDQLYDVRVQMMDSPQGKVILPMSGQK